VHGKRSVSEAKSREQNGRTEWWGIEYGWGGSSAIIANSSFSSCEIAVRGSCKVKCRRWGCLIRGVWVSDRNGVGRGFLRLYGKEFTQFSGTPIPKRTEMQPGSIKLNVTEKFGPPTGMKGIKWKRTEQSDLLQERLGA
jgi:hypothetical protein